MAKAGKKTGPIEFVYGNWCGYGPCVLRTTTAEAIAAEGDDISESATYRNYIERCRSKPDVYDPEWVEDVESWIEESDVSLDDQFDPHEFPGEGDGSFPGDARTAMLDDLPEEVIESDIGELHDAMGGIPIYHLTDNDIPRIVDVLESLGHTVRHDQSIFDRMACP